MNEENQSWSSEKKSESIGTRTDIDHRSWFGWMTIENAERLLARFNRMLDGKRYTFVTADEGSEPHVRTDQKLLEPMKMYGIDSEHAHFGGSDGNYSWGLSTYSHDDDSQEKLIADNAPYIVFSHYYAGWQVYIRHRAPSGRELHWTVAVQEDCAGRL